MVAWARKYGIQSTIHTGGTLGSRSGYIDADTVLEADADIIGHINGGHTALPLRQIRCLCEGCLRGIEIVHNGNELAGLSALRFAAELGPLPRVILGTDGPAGSGAQPLGILRMVALLSSVGDMPAETVFCCATGNTAPPAKTRLRPHRDRPRGGLPADGSCPALLGHGSAGLRPSGDLPGVGMVVIDGIVRCGRSRNTPPAERVPEITSS